MPGGHGSLGRKKTGISKEDIKRCRENRNSREWLEIARFCQKIAEIVYRKTRSYLYGGEETLREIWGNSLCHAAESILLGKVTTERELEKEVYKALNREIGKMKGRMKKSTDIEKLTNIIVPRSSDANPSLEAWDACKVIVEIIKEALTVFSAKNPNYYQLLMKLYTTSTNEPEAPDETFDNDPSTDRIRRAYRAFRDSVLEVARLHRRDLSDDSKEAEYVDELIMHSEDNPKGSQRFKELVMNLRSMEELFQGPRKKYTKRDREEDESDR